MWISELDLCLASLSVIPIISTFTINKELELPSGHAIVSLQLTIESSSFYLKSLVSRNAELSSEYDCIPNIRKPFQRSNAR